MEENMKKKVYVASLVAQRVKCLPAMGETSSNPSSIPGWGRPPGEGNGNPLQYSHRENSMGRGSWQATVHGITKSHALLSNFTSESLYCTPETNTPL